jgi:hypothetical protein
MLRWCAMLSSHWSMLRWCAMLSSHWSLVSICTITITASKVEGESYVLRLYTTFDNPMTHPCERRVMTFEEKYQGLIEIDDKEIIIEGKVDKVIDFLRESLAVKEE